MPDRNQKINDYTEISNNSPQRVRPADKQMGLGTHNLIESKAKENQNKTPNT